MSLSDEQEILSLILNKVAPKKSRLWFKQLREVEADSTAKAIKYYKKNQIPEVKIPRGAWEEIENEYKIFTKTFRPKDPPSKNDRQIYLSEVVMCSQARFEDSAEITFNYSELIQSLKRLVEEIGAGKPAPEQLSRKFLNKVWEFYPCERALAREDRVGKLSMDATIYNEKSFQEGLYDR